MMDLIRLNERSRYCSDTAVERPAVLCTWSMHIEYNVMIIITIMLIMMIPIILKAARVAVITWSETPAA